MVGRRILTRCRLLEAAQPLRRRRSPPHYDVRIGHAFAKSLSGREKEAARMNWLVYRYTIRLSGKTQACDSATRIGPLDLAPKLFRKALDDAQAQPLVRRQTEAIR